MRKRILVALAVVAVAIGGAGVAIAATSPTTVKACANAYGNLRLYTGSCGSNSVVRLVTSVHPGMPRAYAHVNSGGTLDTARSWNVSAANLYTTGNGSYCFKGLNFSPKHAQVSLDFWGPANGDIPVITMRIPPDANTDCGLASVPQAYVFTGLVDPGVFTDGVAFGFYIVLY